ncbi:MAG: hypothetical protein RJB04_399 [Verrucomicrobiota bacterium]|jgi:hypothetical protein
MRTLLLAFLIVLLGIGTSVATFLWGGKMARARIQSALSQIIEASQASAAIKSPEQDILQDPPDVQPAGNERQTELSLAALEAMRETSEPGSLRFDNPDVVNLLNQLRSRQEYQDSREKRLKELEERIRMEMQNLNLATQWIAQARVAQDTLLTNRITYLRVEEQRSLLEHGRRISALPPAQAVAILTNYTPDEIARTLTVINATNASSLLGAMVGTGDSGVRLAADISRRMMQISLRSPDGTNSNAAAPTP